VSIIFKTSTKLLCIAYLLMPLFCQAINSHNEFSNLFSSNIFPEPREFKLYSGFFSCPDKVVIIEENGKGIASKKLSMTLKEYWNIDSVLYSRHQSAALPVFVLKINNHKNLPKTSQGYILKVTGKKVTIEARSKQGLFYGVQTLVEMIKSSVQAKKLPSCLIRDWPASKMRGCYLNLRSIKVSPQTLPALKRLIDTFASLKLNTLVLEIAGNMRFKKVKFVKKSPFSKKQVAELAAYAKERYFEVIPLLQTLSHVKWIYATPGYKELLENTKETSWHTAWCPSNSKVDTFIRDVMEETIEVFKPKYFHISLDEVNWGPFRECPKCVEKEPSKLFLSQVNKLTATLKKHQVTPIIYFDSLLPAKPIPGNPIPTRTNLLNDKVQGWKIIDKLDKSIIINIWDYDIKPNESVVSYFNGKGFSVLAATSCTKSLLNNQSFPKLLEKYPTSLGVIMTYWYHGGDWTKPLSISREALASTLFLAQYSWNPSAENIDNITYDPVYEMRKRIAPDTRHNATPISFKPIRLNHLFNISLGHVPNWPILKGNSQLLDKWIKRLSSLPEKFELGKNNTSEFQGIALSGQRGDGLPSTSVSIPLNIRTNMLSMLHTTSHPNDIGKYQKLDRVKFMPVIGKYIVHYMDDSKITVPLRYRYNIVDWNAALSGVECRMALRSNDACGNLVYLVRCRWTNPSPEKVIRKVEFCSSMYDGIAPVLLAMSASSEVSKQANYLYDLNKKNISDIKKDIGVFKDHKFTGTLNMSLINLKTDSQKILKIIIPPATKGIGRFFLDINITGNISRIKQLKLPLRISNPHAVKISGIYLINSNDSSYWVKYKVLNQKSSDWQVIELSMSSMRKKEAPGLTPQKIKKMRVSLWMNNKTKLELLLKSPEWSRFNIPVKVHLRKKLSDLK
jgi:Glycosyl hydrolase family 20, domain 2/Glycosyl hydrolase family 20, catalytic domain